MKRLLAIFTIAAFAACGGGKTDDITDVDEQTTDTTTMSSQARGTATMGQGDIRDTTDIASGVLGDSTSKSGVHGAGSGSRVGGGATGAPQGKKKQ